jgi:hypothetical protein
MGLLALLFLAFFAGSGLVTAETLELRFTGLEELGAEAVYEGWLIVDGAPVSTGTFSVDGNGVPSARAFEVGGALARASAFVLTIEPNPDPNPGPSETHLVGGDFAGGAATLTVGHAAALGDNFLGASGSYTLAVPSDTSGNTPYTNGIWWLNPAAGPGPSLELPTLPSGWVYEGWVVGPSGPVSTGTFTAVHMADSDRGGPAAGGDPTPPFPGQDFVSPPTNLVGYAAVISIEPFPDNSPAPFLLKPLVDQSIDDLGAAGLLQSMTNAARTFPTGVAIVPEPTSGLLLLLCVPLLLGWRRANRTRSPRAGKRGKTGKDTDFGGQMSFSPRPAFRTCIIPRRRG